jgi:hypothetical protein
VLGRIFEPKRDKVTGGWRTLRNEENEMGRKRSTKGKPEGKRPLGSPRRRWVHNIKMDLGDRMGGIDWIDLAQYRDHQKPVEGPCECSNEPWGSIKCWEVP